MKYFLFLIMTLAVCGSLLWGQSNWVAPRDGEYDYEQLQVDFDLELRRSTYYLNGQRFTGTARENTQDGRMYILHIVRDGWLERQLGYYANGVKCRDFHFSNGLEHGLLELYFPDGTLYTSESYQHGQLHGKLRRWKNGQLLREADFWYGTIISEKWYDVTGEERQTPPPGANGC